MYSQLSKELKASLFQRIKSPFFGSYLIGLFIFNYRFVFLMLSNKSLEDKFKIIEDVNSIIGATPTFYTTLLFPFLFALFYITLVPLFESYVSMPIWKKNQNRLKERYAKLEKQEVFLAEEKSKYLKEILEIRREKEKLVEELTNHDIKGKQNIENEIKRLEKKHNNEIEILKTDYEIKQKDLLEKNEKSLQEEFDNMNKLLLKKNNELSNEIEQKESSLGELILKIEKLERTNEKLIVKEQLLIRYDRERKNFKEEKETLENEKNKLQKELRLKIKEVDKYKEKDILEQNKIDKKLESYLYRFTRDEIKYLTAIYRNNLIDNIIESSLNDKLISLLSMPRIKVEHITSNLKKNGYLYNVGSMIYFSDELRELLVEMFT